MNVLHHSITLYIHPEDNGPTMPVDLDMLAIESVVVGTPLSLNRDEERIKAIAKVIKDKFPLVHPEARIQDLRVLTTRLTQASIYDGIVLNLPGTIEGPPMPKNPAQGEFDRLIGEGMQLKEDLQQIGDKLKEVQRECSNLKAENVRLIDREKTALDTLKPVQQKLKEKENDVQTARAEVGQFKTQLGALQQQYAGLQVQLDRARLEAQTAARDQQELAQLRQTIANFKAKEQQWNETVTRRNLEIAKLQQDLGDLRSQLKRILEQGVGIPGSAPRPAVKDEARKDPYQDDD